MIRSSCVRPPAVLNQRNRNDTEHCCTWESKNRRMQAKSILDWSPVVFVIFIVVQWLNFMSIMLMISNPQRGFQFLFLRFTVSNLHSSKTKSAPTAVREIKLIVVSPVRFYQAYFTLSTCSLLTIIVLLQ